MIDKGFILLHRKTMDSFLYKDSQYIHLWIHLLFRANHKPERILLNGNAVELQRGQFLTSRITLSLETRISQAKVERILNVLQKEKQIEQQKTTKYRIITIVNYNLYQTSRQQTDNKRTTNGQQLDTDKESKEAKQTKQEISLQEWENKNGELTLSFLTDWIEKHNLNTLLLEKELITFKDKCAAKGYKYINFPAAFRLWVANEKYGNGLVKFKKRAAI